jgi:hypothetical protein
MSTIRATYVQHGSSAVPNITLNASGQVIVASGIVSSGTFAAPTGSAAAPGVYFVGDTNTGLYSPGADQVAVATNGEGRLFVTSDGKVGAGTDAPATAFEVQSASNTSIRIDNEDDSTAQLYFHNTGSTDMDISVSSANMTFNHGATERLRITSAGLVGIGTSSPSEKLHVSAASGDVAALVECPGHPILRLKTTGTTDNTSVDFADSGSDTQCRLIYTHNTNLFSIQHSGNNALSIDSSGRVGIGTTSPVEKLSISNSGQNGIEFKPDFNTNNSLITSYNRSTSAYTELTLSADAHIFAEGGTERARIDSSGRLLVGTSTSTNVGSSVPAIQQIRYSSSNVGLSITRDENASNIVLARTSSAPYGLVSNNDTLGQIRWAAGDGTDIESYAAEISCQIDGTPGANDMPGRLVFSTTADGASSPTERMRIDNGGAVSIGTTGAPGSTVFGVAFGRAGNPGLLEQSRNVSGSIAAAVFGGNAGVAYVMGDGDLENTNNRYTGISDIKFKQNIEDASSQWDDIKSIQVRKYELIANPDRKHIGCVAQELEQVCPGLVIEREDQEGEPYKSVAYSVLYMKAVKALQEAIGRIETLEGMVAVNNITIDEQQHQLSTLAARLTALESA